MRSVAAAAPLRARLGLEYLEVRLAPAAAVVSYNSALSELDFVAAAGETITVTAPASNQIQIQLTNTSDTIILGSGTSSDPTDFSGGGSQTVTISNVNSGLAINAFNVNLANHQSSADTLTFGLGASSGIQEVNIGAGTAPASPRQTTHTTPSRSAV